jgi:hypothetical protein
MAKKHKPDLYEILGVPENAGEAWIDRAFGTARERLEQNTKLDPTKRQSALQVLENAHRTLSQPESRAVYDAELEKEREAAASGGLVARLRLIVAVLILVSIAGGGWYWQQLREEQRIQFERERVAAEQAEQRRLAASAEQRRLSEERLEREALERQKEEEKRLELAREQRAQDALSQRYVVDDRYEKAQRDKRTEAERAQRANDELRERFELEKQRQRAQVELDRARRFIDQREQEENLAVQQRQAAERARQIQEQRAKTR